jgi:hypothetical protein
VNAILRPAGLALPAATLAALLAAALAPAAVAGERRLVDEVVAVVESQTITLSELAAETRIRLVEQQGGQVADAVPDRPLLAASLRRMVEERIVLAEVDRLKLFDLDRSEVESAMARLKRSLGAQDRWEAFTRSLQLTDEEVAAALAREIRVARYLDNRLKLAAQLRDSELDEALRGRAPPGKVEREAFRQKLAREKYERLLADLLADLRKRAAVRVLDPLDGEAEAQVVGNAGGGGGGRP